MTKICKLSDHCGRRSNYNLSRNWYCSGPVECEPNL